MNDETTKDLKPNFEAISVRNNSSSTRSDDPILMANCSKCSELIVSLYGRPWSHTLIINRTYHTNGDILMNQSKEVFYCPIARIKEEEVIIVSKLTDAYKLVIEDIAQDIGYVKGAKETTLSVLSGRLTELVEVWKHEETDSETSSV
jgi:hypothetical protein